MHLINCGCVTSSWSESIVDRVKRIWPLLEQWQPQQQQQTFLGVDWNVRWEMEDESHGAKNGNVQLEHTQISQCQRKKEEKKLKQLQRENLFRPPKKYRKGRRSFSTEKIVRQGELQQIQTSNISKRRSDKYRRLQHTNWHANANGSGRRKVAAGPLFLWNRMSRSSNWSEYTEGKGNGKGKGSGKVFAPERNRAGVKHKHG